MEVVGSCGKLWEIVGVEITHLFLTNLVVSRIVQYLGVPVARQSQERQLELH